jgi:alcohol dehydrogenase (cytochrome c)
VIDLRSTALLGILCVFASSGLISSAAPDTKLGEITAERLNQAEKEAGNWLTYGGTYRAWRYNPLNQVNASNVHRLRAAWAFQLGELDGGLQATPLVADGVLYIVGPEDRVFALDAATGKTIWSYFYKYPKGQRYGYGNWSRGLALGHGSVFLGSLDNFVVALDARTGEELWKVNVEDSRKFGCNITGAPLVVRDMVLVGSTGGDSAHRGHIVAFDCKTGQQRWRFNTIPGPGEKGNETWSGDSWKHGGGAAWLTGSYDPELDLIYWGIGNPAADFYGELRKGDNLYTDCIVALKPATGEVAWHFQAIPHDLWDYDAAYECILLDLTVNGRMRKLLLHPNKGGFVWVLDRTNGEFVAGWKYMDSLNWSTGLDVKGVPQGRNEPELDKPKVICPSWSGARSWNHASYSPRTGQLYNIGVEWCGEYTVKPVKPSEGRGYLGGFVGRAYPPSGKVTTHLDAHDPLTGKKSWTFESKYPLLASLLSTGGDLVFTGNPEGDFFALDAKTGKKLWSFPTGSGHRGSPITYAVEGKQYVATPSGWGGLAARALAAYWPETAGLTSGATIFAFTLPESDQASKNSR